MTMKTNLKDVIESEVSEVFALERSMTEVETELRSNPKFVQFLEMQQAYADKYKEVKKIIGDQHILAYKKDPNLKTLKFDFGTMTVRDDKKLDIDESVLPPRYFKSVPNTTKIRNEYDLEGKVPKGVTITKVYTHVMSLKKGEK